MGSLKGLPGLQASLYNLTDRWAKQIEEQMIEKMPEATSNLKDTTTYQIEASENGYEIAFYLANYATFVDKGVNGKKQSWGSPYSFKDKMPPPSAFDKWIVAKGIAPRSKGKFTSREGLKWAIARSVFNNGIKPHNFMQPVIDANIEGLADMTAEEVWQAIKNKIENK